MPASRRVATLQALSALVGVDLLPPQPDAGPAAAAILQQPSATAFGAPTAEQLLLERVPQFACRLFRIFTPRVPCSNVTSRRGAAAYGDDNTFLFWAETLERAPLWVSQLVARTFFTQLFVYVTMVRLYRRESTCIDRPPPHTTNAPFLSSLANTCPSVTRHGRRPRHVWSFYRSCLLLCLVPRSLHAHSLTSHHTSHSIPLRPPPSAPPHHHHPSSR